jgi:hypothetical protein
MNFITTIVKRVLPKDIPMPLGRWGIEQCATKMNTKIDLSNEDHCGPCGQYALIHLQKPQDSRVLRFTENTAYQTNTQINSNISYKLSKNSVPPYMPRSGIVAK